MITDISANEPTRATSRAMVMTVGVPKFGCRLRSRGGSALLGHRRGRGEAAITQQAGHREIAHRHAALALEQPFGHLHAQGVSLFKELQPLQIAQTAFDPLEGFSRELTLGTTLAHGECRLVRES